MQKNFTLRCIAACILLLPLILPDVCAQSYEKYQLDQLVQIKQQQQPGKFILGLDKLLTEGPNSPLATKVRIQDQKILLTAIPNQSAEALRQTMINLGAENCMVVKETVCGWVPLDRLQALERLDDLQLAYPEFKPHTHIGTVTSQGDQAQFTDLVRNRFGFQGKDVTIGILSDSYDAQGRAELGVTSGNLPGPGNPNGFTEPVDVLSEIIGFGSDEGRGMAEIIHDVAPAAKIKFYSAFNGFFDFADGIRALADAGCDIIVDDILYPAEPTFQDGAIAQAVDEVAERGVLYFSSAGNSNRFSYESLYQPIELGPGQEFHNFGGGDILQSILIPPGATLDLWLQWDDPSVLAGNDPNLVNYTGPIPETDFDVFLFDQVTGAMLAQSIFNNPADGIPIEIITYQNTSDQPLVAELLINRFSGPANKRIKYIDFGSVAPNVEYQTLSSTCVGHANADGAIAVGASAYFNTAAFTSNPTLLNGFSSAGGTHIFLDPVGNRLPQSVVREKPLIVGPDGGNTSDFPSPLLNGGIEEVDFEGDGFPNFFGTSASAPHIAAVTALLLEGTDKQLSRRQLRKAFVSTAEDMDDPFTPGFDEGFDFGSGYGFVQSDAALASVLDKPSVFRIELVNPETGEVLGILRDGDEIDIAQIPDGKVVLVGQASAGFSTLGSVEFELRGKQQIRRVENKRPYAFIGDVNGKFIPWLPRTGHYTLETTAYTEKSARGEAGFSQKIAFSVINTAAIDSLILVNADTDEDIGPLGDVIELSSLPTQNISIRAAPNTENVTGVLFRLSGEQHYARFEFKPPYALFGDQEGDYRPWFRRGPEPGKYRLATTVFAGVNMGEPTIREFEVIMGDQEINTAAANSSHNARFANTFASSSELVVFPNPASEALNVYYAAPSQGVTRLMIYSAVGQLVYTHQMSGSIDQKIDLSNLTQGVYIAKTIHGEEIQTKRFTLQ